MAAIYSFCVISDVEQRNKGREINDLTYTATSKPSSTEVKRFMTRIYSELLGIVKCAGYDIDNLYSVSSLATGTLTLGTDASIAVTAGTGSTFAKGDLIKVEGLTSGLRAWEFTEVSNVVTDTLTATLANSYDTAATIILVNNTLDILREINAVGAAWKAEDTAFMMSSINKSDHADMLKEEYYGSEDQPTGIWAIKNLADYLSDAEKLDEGLVKRTSIDSYNAIHENDTDIEPVFEKDEKF